ncbi:MAG: hypothetical protein JXB04_07695 [Kiritimatiellae bacterium]|nr:hypothetical protein [Kiritimatiellia bacterium]
MEKKIYDLCREVLQRLENAGVLDGMILVGSWCMPFYEESFKPALDFPPLRTRDIEFMVRMPPRFKASADVAELLKDLGFIIVIKGRHGYITLQHPDLILEFLAPAAGRERDEPYPVSQLGLNAQPLRFMHLLARDTIKGKWHGVRVTAPHPANFSLHKLLIAGRRKNKDKAANDRAQAMSGLASLLATGERDRVVTLFKSLPKTWQKTIKKELSNLDRDDLLNAILS